MKKPYQFASLSAGLLARKGEAAPAMESFHTAPVSRAAPPMPAFAPHDDDYEDAPESAPHRPDRRSDGADAAHGPESELPIDAARLRAIAASGVNASFGAMNPFARLRKLAASQSDDRGEKQGRAGSDSENGESTSAADERAACADHAAAPSSTESGGCASACGAADQSNAEHRPDPEEEHAARRRATVSVRLDTPDYLRLKLASAQLHRTIQDLISTALDDYLDRLGVESMRNCRCLRLASRAEQDAPAE